MTGKIVPVRAVYAITCVDGRAYIGSSINADRRWLHHRTTLRSGTNSNRNLQAAWDALGEGSFSFGVLEHVSEDKSLVDAEQRHMNSFRERGVNLFNLAPMAASTAGVVYAEDSKARHPEKPLVPFTRAPQKRKERDKHKAEGSKRVEVVLTASQSLKLDLLASEAGKPKASIIAGLIEGAK